MSDTPQQQQPTSSVPPPRGPRAMTPEDRLRIYEAWWPFIARVLSFLFGSGIMFWQAVVVNVDRPWLIVAATGMMGLPIANVLGKMLSAGAAAATGGQAQKPPQKGSK